MTKVIDGDSHLVEKVVSALDPIKNQHMKVVKHVKISKKILKSSYRHPFLSLFKHLEMEASAKVAMTKVDNEKSEMHEDV